MKPINLGIVGLGRAGKGMHLSELKGKEDMFKVCAVCDREADRREPIAEEYGAKCYATIEELVADPEVEVVDIATRSCDHYAHAKMALLAGKNVFLEKPFSVTYEQAKELAELSNKPGLPRLFIRHNRRWEGKFNQIMRLCDDGTIGDVFEVKLTRNSFSGRRDWQTLSEFGGGQLLNWGPHVVDQALRFAGDDYTEMFADLHQVLAAGDCEDCVRITLKGVNGRSVDLEIICAAALPSCLYTAYGSRGALEDRGEVVHVRRLVEGFEMDPSPADPGNPGQTFASGQKLEFEEFDIPADPEPELDQTWGAMFDDLRRGIPYRIKMDEALKVIEVIDKAAKTGIR